MNYRSVHDLNQLIAGSCHRVPNEVDLIVGVPRSGMLAANLLALHLNLPVTDINGLLEDRSLKWGMHRSPSRHGLTSVDACRKILVIDDSILSGRQMNHVRERIEAEMGLERVLFSAVYCTKQTKDLVDIAFEDCPVPRVFEWNVMHSDLLEECCVDIDGVLCPDPTPDQNDDGERYANFIAETPVFLRPTCEVGVLVTSRLEKYRALTEGWLAKHDIRYRELVMMQYATMEERQQAAAYAEYKAEAYAAADARLFIESSAELAASIAAISGRPVLAIDIQEMCQPFGLPRALQRGRQVAKESLSIPRRALRKLGRIALGA